MKRGRGGQIFPVGIWTWSWKVEGTNWSDGLWQPPQKLNKIFYLFFNLAVEVAAFSGFFRLKINISIYLLTKFGESDICL